MSGHAEAGNDLLLRPATQGDWSRIAELLAASALPLAGAREHLDGFVVALRAAELVGCAAVERHGDAGLLRSVAVGPRERGRGTGAALVERCIAEAVRAGINPLVLLTTTADRYFPRFGFRVADRREVPDSVRASAEFRGACPDSAVVMTLALGPPRGSSVIRPARPDDAAAIAEIYNAGIRDRTATFETRERTGEEIEAWFGSGRYPILVAERDGEVVGWIAASSYRSRECYSGIAEFSLYVAPAARGKRIGDGLMRELLPALERAGFWKVLARIFTDNTGSRALCRAHGFREVGVYQKHGRLDGVWRDVVIVERLIGPAS